MADHDPRTLTRRVRLLLVLFMAGLVISGLTAFPLVTESTLLTRWLDGSWLGHALPTPTAFLDRAHTGLAETTARYPFIAYGTDWLAFAHLTIAVAFLGPLRDPVRNVWVIQFGMIACAGIIPLALIAGQIRDIPFYWRCVDMSFGVVGILPLLLAHRYVRRLAELGHAGS